MKAKCNSKLNLYLEVLNKTKPESYHDLVMFNVSTSLSDILKVNFIDDHKSNTFIKCNIPIVPIDNRNLVYKVIDKFRKLYKLDFSIKVKLIKRIPMEAGLAGGSSDAYKMYELLNKHFKNDYSFDDVKSFFDGISSDAPYFYFNSLSKVEGKGDKVTKLNTRFKKKVMLVKPYTGCLTKDVYQNIDYSKLKHNNTDLIESMLVNNDFDSFVKIQTNSLEESACLLNDNIKPIINKLKAYGFELVSMTGSGSCVYAISKKVLPYIKALLLLKRKDYQIVKIVKTK